MKKSPFQISKIFLWVAALSILGCQGPERRATPREVSSGKAGSGVKVSTLLGPQSERAAGEQRVLVVPVRFKGINPRFSLGQIKRRVVTGLTQYVKEQSYGLARVRTHFKDWVLLPDALSEYRVSPNNFQVDRERVRKLIEDTMSAIEDETDFSSYRYILIIPGVMTLPGRGYGMMCYCANPGMLTGVRGNPGYVTLKSTKGQTFSGGVFVGAENAHLGMFAHDFFHAMGGVYAGRRLVP